MSARLSYLASLLALVPCAALGSGPGPIVKLGKLTKVKAVRESTDSVFPQIGDIRSPIPMSPENPFEEKYRDWRHTGSANALPLGGMLEQPRARVLSNQNVPGALWPGMAATNWYPADPTVAVSSKGVVEVVNCSIAFYDRSGNVLFQQLINGSTGFFASVGAGNFVFDPKCFFDPLSKHFFVVALETDDANKVSEFNIAVSATDDPRGVWNKYRLSNKLVQGSNQYWLDYPGWGFNKDWVVASGNMFPLPGTNNFGGVQVFAFNKANLIAGSTSGSFNFLAPNAFTVQWAKCADPSEKNAYAVSVNDTSSMSLWALTGGTTNPQLVTTNVTVPQFQFPSTPAVALGSQIDPLDGRILTTAVNNGHLVASHTVDTGAGDHRNAARWYDFSTNGWPSGSNAPSLVQSGQLSGGAGEHYTMPAVNINHSGTITMIATHCSPTNPTDIVVTARLKGDRPGFMGKTTTLQSGGSGAYNGWRWGDYFAVEKDPGTDNSTLFDYWGVAMAIRDDGNWGTYIQRWRIPEIFNPFPITGTTITNGLAVGGSPSNLSVADKKTYDLTATNVANLGDLAGVMVSFQAPTTKDGIEALQANVVASGPKEGTLQIFGIDSTGAATLLSSGNLGATTSVVLNNDQIWPYMNDNGSIRLLVRAIVPSRQHMAGYTFKIDQVSVAGLTKS